MAREFSGLQSRVETLYRSNDAPFSEDITLITGILEERLAHIFKLEQQLSKLRAEVKVYQSILAPIRKLPPELLAEIFLHYTAAIRRRDFRFSGSICYPRPDRHSPIVLSHVCRKWHSVAVSSPSLWTYICLPHRTPLGSSRYADLVDRCLKNSSVLPLNIVISILGSNDEEYRTTDARSLKFAGALATIDAFMPHIERWKHFQFDVLTSRAVHLKREFPTIPPNGASSLLRVFFRAHLAANSSSPEISWAVQLIRSSPNLQSIELVAPIYSLEAAPWLHLERFISRRGIRMKDLFMVFSSCPLLQKCEACFELDEEGPSLPSFDSSDSIIQLSHLHSLSLTHLRQSELTTVLRWLTLPSLQTLTLAGHHVSDTWPDELFQGFLSRSACKLVSLSLSRFSYTDDNIMDYVRLPNVHETLEHLELDKWKTPISPELLEFLTFQFGRDGPPVLPNLKNISIAIHAIVQAVRLREFFLSRWYEQDRYQVPYPVAALEQLNVLLLVPYLPNATVSSEHIRNMFSRVEDIVMIDLVTSVVEGGTDYPGIEKLGEMEVI